MDGIYPWYRRRYGHIYDVACPDRCLTRSWSRELFAELALNRPLHLEEPWKRLRSWRNRCRISPWSFSNRCHEFYQRYWVPLCSPFLDIQILNVFRIGLDELTSWFYLVTHQSGKGQIQLRAYILVHVDAQ